MKNDAGNELGVPVFFVPKSFLERRKIEDAKVRDRWQVKLLGPNISPSYIRIQPPAESRETNG